MCRIAIAYLEAEYDPVVQKAHQAHRAACELRAKKLQPWQQGANIYKLIGVEWWARQASIRAAEQARLDAEAKRLADAQAEADAQAAEQAGAPPEAVQAIRDAPPPPVYAVAPPNTQAVAGVRPPRKVYRARVDSPLKLVCAIAEGRAPIELVKAFDLVFLNRMAESMKELMSLPGVSVHVEYAAAAAPLKG